MEKVDEFTEKALEGVKVCLDVLFISSCALCFIRHVVTLSLIFSLISAHPADIVHYRIPREAENLFRPVYNNRGSFRINQFDQYYVSFSKFPRLEWDRITWTTFVTIS